MATGRCGAGQALAKKRIGEEGVSRMTKLLNRMTDEVQAVGRIAFGAVDRRGKIVAAGADGGHLRYTVHGGPGEAFDDAALRTLTAEFVRFALDSDLSCLALEVEGADALSPQASEAAAEGALAGACAFIKYRTQGAVRAKLASFALIGGDEDGLERGRIVGEALSFARSLANEPANVVTPEAFVSVARRLAGRATLSCEFYDEWEIAGFGMNGLMAVGRGSANPPRLVHMVYRPGGLPVRRVAVVGKGVTFDSGGLCIKGSDEMQSMKYDKSGACVMMGVLRAAAELRLPIEVHGIAALVENMPDGAAYRPGDIVRTMSGKTVEVQDTDCEGRLVLADVLTFASRLEPDALIDVATLTGSVKDALGKYTAALVCDDDGLSAALLRAAGRAGERFHRFTMDDERLREGLRGTFADLRPYSPDGGGPIAGGMFLREFVKPGVPWAHIDIGATGWYDREFGVYARGASAYSLTTVVEYLRDVAAAEAR